MPQAPAPDELFNPFEGVAPQEPTMNVNEIEVAHPQTLSELFRGFYDGRDKMDMNSFRASTNVEDRTLDDGMFDQDTVYQARQDAQMRLKDQPNTVNTKYLTKIINGKKTFTGYEVTSGGNIFTLPPGSDFEDTSGWQLTNTVANIQEKNRITAESAKRDAENKQWAKDNLPANWTNQ